MECCRPPQPSRALVVEAVARWSCLQQLKYRDVLQIRALAMQSHTIQLRLPMHGLEHTVYAATHSVHR